MDTLREDLAKLGITASTLDDASSLSMILVMGITGSGKSYFLNQLKGDQVVDEGAGLESCQSYQNLPPHHVSLRI